MNLRTTSRPVGALRATVVAATLVAACGTALAAPVVPTATIVLDPPLTTVDAGDTFTVDVSVLAASNFIGAYDFTLAFGTAGILSLQSVSFAGALGLNDGVDQFSPLPDFGEVSKVLDLSALQGTTPFDLATLTFKALSGGTTTLSLTPNLAGDVDGNPITLTLEGASVTVNGVAAIPEPSTYALMALGLAAVGFAARRKTIR